MPSYRCQRFRGLYHQPWSLLSWRWEQQASSKRWYLYTKLHSITSHHCDDHKSHIWVHTFAIYLTEIHFNLYPLDLPNGLLSLRVLTMLLYKFIIFSCMQHVQATSSSLIWRPNSVCEEYTLWSSSMCKFLHHFPFLVPTLPASPLPLLGSRIGLSQPYKITCKISFDAKLKGHVRVLRFAWFRMKTGLLRLRIMWFSE
jgi:hypothetical protein